MALAYLIEPAHQWQDRRGLNNVAGWVEVFLSQTDDRAPTYSDFSGTLNPARIGIDNNGRAVIIADSSKAYRIEHYLPNGELMFTQDPVWTLSAGGGGVSGSRVISTDGSIAVDASTASGVTTYDIGLAPSDSDEFLEWVKCSEEGIANGNWYPVYVEGTMETATGRGLHVNPGRLYHLTATVKVDPTGTGAYYNTISANIEFSDGEEVTHVARRNFDIDSSCDDPALCEFSYDFIPGADGYLFLDIEGVSSFTAVDVELQVHRVYSGISAVPDTCATKQWVKEYYDAVARDSQADWDEDDSTKPSYIRNRPDLSLYVTDAELENILGGYVTASDMDTALAGKQDVINDLSDIRSGAAAGATAVQPATLNDYATTSAMNTALAGKQDTISDLQTIREGAALGATAVQPVALNDYVTSSALATTLADYVTDTELGTILDGYATTTALSNGLAGKQDTISDLSDIRSGAALGATAVQPAALNDYATTSAMNTALAGKQDTISDLQTIREGAAAGATAVQPAALNDYATTSAMNTALAGKQDTLTAGSNISISGSTISATDTTYTAGTALELTGTEFSVKVDGSTVTVNSSGELQAAPAITVDQTYDPTSTNPQSGTAVAEAVAGVDTSLFEAVYGQTSLADIQQAIANKRIVYCRVPSGNMARMAFLAFDFGYSVEFQYYRSLSSHSASDMTDEVYVYTVSSTGWTTTTRKTGVKVTAGTHMSQSYSNGTLTLNAAWPTVDQTYDASSENAQSGVAVAGALATKQDTLTAGTNIQISNGTISATDTTYTAGTGLDLTGTEFSVDTTTIATKAELADYVTDTELSTILQGYQEALTAGSNITISNGTISATDTTYTAGTGLDLTGTEFSVDTTTIATKAELADYTPTASLAAVALSNDYDDLSNKPVIPVLPTTKDLVAGSNITITEGQDTVTIAATAASYSAGSGLNLTGSTFSVDTTTIQEKLTAGSNITISGNTISSTAVPQLQANWAEGNTQSVQYIMNKPTIPVLPSTKDLVAGDNITLTEGNDDITVACSITIGTVTV